MKRTLLMAVMTAGLAAAQTLDFSSLDKLAARADEANKISLNHDQIESALKLLKSIKTDVSEQDMAQLMQLAKKVSGIEVRNYTFGKAGQYADKDLSSVRSQLNGLKNWSKIIDSKEKGERSEIYMNNSGKDNGLAIIAAEETEVSVILIKGTADLKDLGSLSGTFGLPSIRIGPTAGR